MSDKPAILSPAGLPVTYEQELENRQRQITKGLRQWLAHFADVLKFYKIAMHCGVCHATLFDVANCWRHWGECPGFKKSEDSDLVKPVLKTNTGMEWLAGPVRPREELRSGQMEWFRQFMDVAVYLSLGLHCQSCSTDMSGLNADTDAVYSMACSCRELLGNNREYVEPATEVVH